MSYLTIVHFTKNYAFSGNKNNCNVQQFWIFIQVGLNPSQSCLMMSTGAPGAYKFAKNNQTYLFWEASL